LGMDEKTKARKLLKEWKGDSYIFGLGVLEKVGGIAKGFGDNALLVGSSSKWAQRPLKTITESLKKEKVSFNITRGARPNCPREDLYRISLQIAMYKPDSVIAFGGGSTIDGVKAASVLATYTSAEVSEILGVGWDKAGSIDPYFGTDIVSKMKAATNRDIIPVIAVQTASSSAAHLTKYSNITDPLIGQKKLIVDDAITPKKAVFDYGVTIDAPRDLTLDGGLDGLGTDLGGYSIMIGGTNGPHLGSFSLVDILSHGRACAILNPYYTVFFSPNIQDQLLTVGPIFQEAGFIEKEVDLQTLESIELGKAVAEGMINFNRSLGFPTTLKEAGATTAHLDRMLESAKDPQLKMKLLNMPVPLDPEKGDIDKYMKGVLKAAFTGDFAQIRTK